MQAHPKLGRPLKGDEPLYRVQILVHLNVKEAESFSESPIGAG